MNANELRIGNYVTIHNLKHHPKMKGIPLRVTGVCNGSNGFMVSLEHISQEPNTYYMTYSQWIKFIAPIPLTEELLYLCGFEKKVYDEDDYELDLIISKGLRLRVHPDMRNMAIQRFDRQIEATFGTKRQSNTLYLHELQNFYFALTNKELIINIK